MKLVIVESPAKAQTINKYLGNNYKVVASIGHVRDLPRKDGAVEPEKDFQMSWDQPLDKKKVINGIIKDLKDAETLILATDPDREGEAISWHINEILNEKNLARLTKVPSISRIFIAISINGVRLIDNMRIEYKLACSTDGLLIVKDISF